MPNRTEMQRRKENLNLLDMLNYDELRERKRERQGEFEGQENQEDDSIPSQEELGLDDEAYAKFVAEKKRKG